MSRRLLIAVAAGAALLAGCGAGGTAAAWVDPPGGSAVGVLQDARARARAASVRAEDQVTFPDCPGAGSWRTMTAYDLANQEVDVQLATGTGQPRPYFRVIKSDLYLNPAAFGLSIEQQWLHLDLARVPRSSWLHGALDDRDYVAGSMTSAYALGNGWYAGTIDLFELQQQIPYETPRLDLANQIDTMGNDQAMAVPFLAQVDQEGRLVRHESATQRTINGKACRSIETSRLFDFGAPVDVEAPPADQIEEASADLYQQL